MAVTRTPTLAAAEIHDILRNERRRSAIELLRVLVDTLTIRELAEHIAAEEHGDDPAPRALRESVYNSLHQTHLPKLDRDGVVDYDSNRKTVALRPAARDVDAYMDVVTRYGITWAEFYRSLGVGALAVVVGSEAGFPGFDVLPAVAWASVALAALAGATAYQLWTRRWRLVRALLD
jgi:hypothetical protein